MCLAAGFEPAFTPATGKLCLERIEALLPEAPEVAEPLVELPEWRRIHGVQPPRAVRPHPREPAVAEHPEVLGNSRLGDAELRLHDVRDRAGAQLASGEELQDATANRIAEDVECVHTRDYRSVDLYKSSPS